MSYTILESSERAKQIATRAEPLAPPLNPKVSQRVSKYPFAELQICQSFAVPFDEVGEISLRTLASTKSKDLGRKFTVIKHNDSKVFEVARVA